MKAVYDKYKGKFIDSEQGYVAGYSDSHIIVAKKQNCKACFRRLDKGTYISEDFKSKDWRYVYFNEMNL